jgi:3-deoxy-7-phosphoheptulonate synthase
MIIVLKAHASDADIQAVDSLVRTLRYQPRVIRGVERTVIACVGDELSNRSLDVLRNLPAVDQVLPIQQRYKLVSRAYHEADSVVTVGGVPIGGGAIAIIAGPCAIESGAQFHAAVRDLTAAGIRLIRAMPFKPRTSPYDFQGLKVDGIAIMREIKQAFDVALVSEALGPAHVELLHDVADMIQIGARNAQNYDLLEIVAQAGKPVLLKRGMASTVEEWLAAAEYLVVNGCPNVVLCERGLRSFDKSVRNLLDLGGVAVARQETHLPVLVDPSHAAGKRSLVMPLACAALGAGADGLIVEAHPDPVNAFSDAAQQIESGRFSQFLNDLRPWIDLARQMRATRAPAS